MGNKKVAILIIVVLIIVAGVAIYMSQKQNGGNGGDGSSQITPTPTPTPEPPINIKSIEPQDAKAVMNPVFFADSAGEIILINSSSAKTGPAFEQHDLKYYTTKSIASNEKAFTEALTKDGYKVSKVGGSSEFSTIIAEKEGAPRVTVSQSVENKKTKVEVVYFKK